MPDAARISDPHVCPQVEPGPVPHLGGPTFSGSADVIVGYLPAARVRDRLVCVPLGPADTIRKGSSTVIINQRSAARRTDPTSHGGIVVAGCPTVVIGDSPQSFTMRAAAAHGTPFCEECERQRRAQHEQPDDPPGEVPPGSATLDDAAPPPGARAAHDHAVDSGPSLTVLAATPNLGDGADDLRQHARAALAWNFYLDHCADTMSPSDIDAHVRAMDLRAPVEVVEIPPFNKATFYQRGIPNAELGQYFALEQNIPPDRLGISADAYPYTAPGARIRVMPAVPRDSRRVTFAPPADTPPVLGLKSTAGPANDTWSKPGTADTVADPVACSGGATQLVIPKHAHTHAEVTWLP